MCGNVSVYANVFPNIKKQVVELTQELIRSGIWKKEVSDQDKFISMGLWVQRVADLYGMERPKLYFVGGKEGLAKYKLTGGGSFNPELNAIFLYHRLSLTTLIHEFRHGMQLQILPKLYKNDEEHDARAWSLSLYRLSAPESFQKANQKGVLKV